MKFISVLKQNFNWIKENLYQRSSLFLQSGRKSEESGWVERVVFETNVIRDNEGYLRFELANVLS